MSFSPKYVQQEAQEMMTLSAVAYAGEGTNDYGKIEAAIEAAMASSPIVGKNYQLVWLGVSSDFGNVMYIARDNRAPARFAVVVRGTDWDFLSDLKEDFDVLSTNPWPTAQPPDPSIYVAAGAWSGLQTLTGLTSNLFNMTPPAIPQPSSMITLFMAEALWNTYDTDVDIFVTGHSLGGAMATVVGLWLSDTASRWVLRPNKVNVKSYTFAAPTVGNSSFASYYDAQPGNKQVGWSAFRVHIQEDDVPYAYQSLGEIPENGIPVSFGFGLEVVAAVSAAQATLSSYNVSYVQVGSASNGTAVTLSNNPPSTQYPPPSNAANPATSWTEYSVWVGYEHDHNLYLTLLGAPIVDLPQSAVDTAAIARTKPPAKAQA